MKLSHCSDLLAIVEHGSLRSAARHLGTPQSALTRSIRSLEKELKVALFQREARGMTLTPMGQLFHRRASTIVHEVRRAQDELAQAKGDDDGVVVAGLSIMPHLGMLPSALPVFRRRYPKVRLELVEGLFPELEAGLREGSLDFYLGAAPQTLTESGLTRTLLFENTRAVVARKGHPLAGSRTLKSLAGADWATTSVDYDARTDLEALFASHDLAPPAVVLQTRSALSMMVGLANSDLLALLPVQWADSPLTRDALVRIPVREHLPAPPIVLVHRADLPLTPAAEFLCDVLARHVPAKPRARARAA